MSQLTKSASWRNLQKHYKKISELHMRELFEKDPNRFNNFSIKFNDFLLDYSKNRITDDTINLLLKLGKDVKLKTWIRKMFEGSKINITEDRAVLHTALRNRSDKSV